jgi:hypothetical protein
VAADGALVLHIGHEGLRIHQYESRDEAVAAYFDLEKKHSQDNLVMVNADTFSAIRTAYNYSELLPWPPLPH